MEALNIFGYADYREYLKDYYENRKAQPRGYSFRQFSARAGFSSPNILKLVMSGERNLSPASTEKFLKGLGLTGHKAEYFRVLVRMNQTTSVEEKACCYDILKRLTPTTKRKQLDTEAVEYLSHWLFPVLRETVMLPDFSDDPYWISRRLVGRATVKEIRHALNFLRKGGFIQKGDDGRWTVRDTMVLSTDEIRSMAVQRFHRNILEQASGNLENLPVEMREFGALTFLLPESAFTELKTRLKDFRASLHQWAVEAAERSGDNDVIQINIQMYPQTRKEVG